MPIPANVIVMMPSGSVPTGWSAVSDMNSKFPKGTTGDSTSTGGSATHTHSGGSHTHSETSHGHGLTTTNNNAAASSAGLNQGGQGPSANHTHTSTPSNASGTSGSASNSWDSDNHEPSYYNFLYIKSDGTPEGLPNGCVALYMSNSAPTGWTAHSASQGKFARGNSSGGGTGGAGTAHTHAGTEGSHTHSAGNHTHAGSGQSTMSQYSGEGEKGGYGSGAHFHVGWGLNSGGAHTSGSSAAGTSASATPEPSYRKVAGYINNSGEDQDTIGIICMWQGSVGSIPDAYTLCNGSNGTPDMNGRFLRMASGDNDGTGGSTTHSHTYSNSHSHSTSSHTHGLATTTWGWGQCVEQGSGTGSACYAQHSGGTSGSATLTFGNSSTTAPGSVNHEPAYRYIRYIQQSERVSASFIPTVTMFDD
jgi:hypothetical protein